MWPASWSREGAVIFLMQRTSRSADEGEPASRIEERQLRGDVRVDDGLREGGIPVLVTGARALQGA
jgi:hypothetical protein